MPSGHVKELVPMGFAPELDVAELDFLPLDVHPQDRPGKNDCPFTVLVVREQGPKVCSFIGIPLTKKLEILYLNKESASTGFFKALS